MVYDNSLGWCSTGGQHCPTITHQTLAERTRHDEVQFARLHDCGCVVARIVLEHHHAVIQRVFDGFVHQMKHLLDRLFAWVRIYLVHKFV